MPASAQQTNMAVALPGEDGMKALKRPDDVVRFINALERLGHVNDAPDAADLTTQMLFLEALRAYTSFILAHLQRIFERVGLQVHNRFVQEKNYTVATGYPFEELLNVLDGHCSHSENSQSIRNKLAGAADLSRALLSEKDAICIIQGVQKLERLLPNMDTNDLIVLDYRAELFFELDYFNRHHRQEKNPFIGFVLAHIQGPTVIPEEVFVPAPSLKEKKLLSVLRRECLSYKAHIDKGLSMYGLVKDVSTLEYVAPENETNQLTRPVLIQIEKYNSVQRLLSILERPERLVSEKIEAFSEELEASRVVLSRHRDPDWIKWSKHIALCLSSLMLGAGLIYSYVRTGSCNFFKAQGERLSDRLDDEISNVQNELN